MLGDAGRAGVAVGQLPGGPPVLLGAVGHRDLAVEAAAQQRVGEGKWPLGQHVARTSSSPARAASTGVSPASRAA